MLGDESVWRLADGAGIERRYWDILGQLHETTPDTARMILGALGLAADSEGEIAASLAVLAEEEWRSALPSVVVAQENEHIIVPLRLPSSGGTNMLRWSVQLESGEFRTGECDIAALQIAKTGQRSGAPMVLHHLALAPLPIGYHEFRLAEGETTLLIVAPQRCYLPHEGRHWGIAVQLYAVNSKANWGIGDFGDLRVLVDQAAANGAGAVGLNPMHALFLDAPEQASPYSPNSRLFRNPLFLDVTAIPDLAESVEARALIEAPEVAPALSGLRASDYVQYQQVADIKLAALQHLHRSFLQTHILPGTARGRAFRNFVGQSGHALRRFATFQTLSEIFATHDWSRWPAGFQDCDSRAATELGERHADRISFFSYLQWLCEEQLAQAAGMARQGGMAIGLYNDLAVSVDASSADHWAHQNSFAAQLRVGAPPDPFNERGQEWGVVPLDPRKLTATRYAHFVALLRANMRHAGALRIDHVMGWQRLFVIPAGAPATSGAYVRFPMEDLLAIAALESQRNRCMIIGEDLGTVPAGFRERMADANVLSTRVYYFEREHGRFRAPSEYPTLAAVTATTHDLPTLRGFWVGDDIAAKAQLGTLTPDEATQARAARAHEKRLLLRALADEDLMPAGLEQANAEGLDWSPILTRAVHLYLSRTPSKLLMIQLDDLANQMHQANLPGSTTEYPNWRRRLSRALVDLLTDPVVREQMAATTVARES